MSESDNDKKNSAITEPKKSDGNIITAGKRKIDKHKDDEAGKRYQSRQAMRQWKYDKRWSMKRKDKIKTRKYFKNHDDILEAHIPYGSTANKSPHIMVNHWYHRLKNNCILLKFRSENGDKKNRKVFYEIEDIGKNVKWSKKKLL